MTDPQHAEKPKLTPSQILLVATGPIVIMIVIPLNVFLGLTVALTFAAVAAPVMFVVALFLNRRERKRWAARE